MSNQTIEFIYVADRDEVLETGRRGGRLNQETGILQYTSLTLKEYNDRYRCNWQPIKESELNKLVDQYIENQQQPWVEIDEERYENMLNCMPPMKWTRSPGGIEFFFMPEALNYTLRMAFVKDNYSGKYYESVRDSKKSVTEIIDGFKKSLQAILA